LKEEEIIEIHHSIKDSDTEEGLEGKNKLSQSCCEHDDEEEEDEYSKKKKGTTLSRNRKIPSWEYLNLKKGENDTKISILNIKRKCFIDRKTTYTIDEYKLKDPLYLLKKHRTKDNRCSSIDHLPDWITHAVDRAVTDEHQYSAWGIAEH